MAANIFQNTNFLVIYKCDPSKYMLFGSRNPFLCKIHELDQLVVQPKQDGWRRPSWISEKWKPTGIKLKFASFLPTKLIIGTQLITRVGYFGHFVFFKIATSDWLNKRKPLCRDITCNYRTPKMDKMSLFGHFDANQVIFEGSNISNMADDGHLGFGKYVCQLKWNIGLHHFVIPNSSKGHTWSLR